MTVGGMMFMRHISFVYCAFSRNGLARSMTAAELVLLFLYIFRKIKSGCKSK
jgi:hypothetical protein